MLVFGSVWSDLLVLHNYGGIISECQKMSFLAVKATQFLSKCEVAWNWFCKTIVGHEVYNDKRSFQFFIWLLFTIKSGSTPLSPVQDIVQSCREGGTKDCLEIPLACRTFSTNSFSFFREAKSTGSLISLPVQYEYESHIHRTIRYNSVPTGTIEAVT